MKAWFMARNHYYFAIYTRRCYEHHYVMLLGIYTDARVFALRIRVSYAFSMRGTHVRFKVR